jgi:hypothetical protein
VIDEYDGTASGAGGNREAYRKATQWAADPAGHSVLRGSGPSGAILRLRKKFITETQDGPDVVDEVNTTMQIPPGGDFEWHVNASTRPAAARGGKRENWVLTCEDPEGSVRLEQLVFVRRGETLEVEPGPCPPRLGPITEVPAIDPPLEILAPNPRDKPRVLSSAAGSFDGRAYRVRVKGSLRDTADAAPGPARADPRCGGKVTITVSKGRRKLKTARARVGGDCKFSKTVKLKRGKRPLRVLTVVTRYAGSPALLPAKTTKRIRVRTRR